MARTAATLGPLAVVALLTGCDSSPSSLGTNASDDACAVSTAAVEASFFGSATFDDIRSHDLSPDDPDIIATDCTWIVVPDQDEENSLVRIAIADYGSEREATKRLSRLLESGTEITVGPLVGVEELGTQTFAVGSHMVNVQAFIGGSDRPARLKELLPIIEELVETYGG